MIIPTNIYIYTVIYRVTFTSDDGRFSLDGCGDDFDWIPAIKNKPEPYIQVS